MRTNPSILDRAKNANSLRRLDVTMPVRTATPLRHIGVIAGEERETFRECRAELLADVRRRLLTGEYLTSKAALETAAVMLGETFPEPPTTQLDT